MPSLKELNVKIASLKNTQKMTKTMKLVSASKLRRAQQAQEQAREYAGRLQALLGNVAGTDTAAHPLLTPRHPARKALILFIVSDRGLCAGFNNNLCRYTARWIADNPDGHEDIAMSFCGRRGHAFFRNRLTTRHVHEGITERPRFEAAARVADELMQAFSSGELDAVYIGFNRFQSALTQVPTLEQLLPLPPAPGGARIAEALYEPDKPELLMRLIPSAVRFRVFHALLENAAGEHAARMTAMENATRNAGDMIKFYTLKRNRERQAAITKELIEIVTGAESL